MKGFYSILAQEWTDLMKESQSPGLMSGKEMLLIAGGFAVAILIAFAGAIIYVKKRKRRKSEAGGLPPRREGATPKKDPS